MKATKTKKSTFLEEEKMVIKTGTEVMRVIDNKFRQKILQTIHELGEPNVTEIYTRLKMQQPVCSIHLKHLRKFGFVKTRREHKLVYYSVNYEVLSKLFLSIRNFTE